MRYNRLTLKIASAKHRRTHNNNKYYLFRMQSSSSSTSSCTKYSTWWWLIGDHSSGRLARCAFAQIISTKTRSKLKRIVNLYKTKSFAGNRVQHKALWWLNWKCNLCEVVVTFGKPDGSRCGIIAHGNYSRLMNSHTQTQPKGYYLDRDVSVGLKCQF